MAKIASTLSIGLTYRNADEIAQVQQLQAEVRKHGFTMNDIYLLGLQILAKRLKENK